MMNNKYIKLCFFVLALVLTACGTDNFDEPTATLRGRVVYKGQPVQVKSGAVELQLYQDGYAKKDPIGVQVAQDGTFQASLFKGTYKLITKNGNGPWQALKDTTVVNVEQETTHDVEVTPYYMLANATMQLGGSTVKASVELQKIVPEATVASAILVIGKTTIVDESWNVAKFEMNTDLPAGTYPLTLDLKDNAAAKTAKHLYGRIGVKASGADTYVFTQVFDLGAPSF